MADINIKHIFSVYIDNSTSFLQIKKESDSIYESNNVGIARIGCFTKVGGLTMEVDVMDFKTGRDRNMRKIPTLPKFGTITLEKGFDTNLVLKEWFDKIYNITNGGADITYETKMYIFVGDRRGIPKYLFVVTDAWVSKYEAEDLDGKSTDVWLEKAEIQHKGFQIFFIDGTVNKATETLDKKGFELIWDKVDSNGKKGIDQDGFELPDFIEKIIL